jgi:hypothetical protein
VFYLISLRKLLASKGIIKHTILSLCCMVHWQEPRIYETAWRIFVKTGFSMSAPKGVHWNFVVSDSDRSFMPITDNLRETNRFLKPGRLYSTK